MAQPGVWGGERRLYHRITPVADSSSW
jgi:hypothetical protein